MGLGMWAALFATKSTRRDEGSKDLATRKELIKILLQVYMRDEYDHFPPPLP